jgi:nucleoid-associated protein YgaU
MRRYNKIKRKIDKSGKRVFSTTYYPEIPIRNTDKFITSVFGDRLEQLAYRFYGDTTLWWVIARANGEFNGDLRPKIGRRITIPTDISDSIRELNNLNSSRE